MKYDIRNSPVGIEIELDDLGDQGEKLLTAFQACQTGQCSCPTNEYEKLDALDITADGESIHLRLIAKADSQLDLSEIDFCLSHAIRQVDSLSGEPP